MYSKKFLKNTFITCLCFSLALGTGCLCKGFSCASESLAALLLLARETAFGEREENAFGDEKRLRRRRSVLAFGERNSAHLFSFALHRISLVTEGDTHRRSLENSSLRLACVAGSLFERPPSASEGGLSKRDSVHRLCTFGARRRRCTGGLSASERFQAKTTMTTQVSSEDNRNRTKKPKTRNPFQTISI